MSSIYIPNMEMPTRCWDCDLCYDSFYCRAIEVQFSDREDFEPGERRLSDCPLIPVPDHGRLIDADALEYFADDSGVSGFDYVTRMRIRKAPTIIPAEEG